MTPEEFKPVLAAALAQNELLDKENKKLTEQAAVQAAIRAGADGGRSTVEITTESVGDTLKGYDDIGADNSIGRGKFFGKKIAPIIAKMGPEFSLWLGERLRNAHAKAAQSPGDYASVQAANSLGTMVGNLVAQQALALLKFRFPVLGSITKDFSNLSADFNQTIITRVKTVIGASQYSAATGYTPASSTDTDVSVTLSHHPYCQVQFNANELASTNRDLFGEQAEVVSYAVGLDIVNALYALFTTGNFSLGSQKTVQALTGWGRGTVLAIRQAMTLRGVEPDKRTLLLYPSYYNTLAQDPSIVSMAAFHRTEIITEGTLGRVAGFDTFEAANLPNTGNLVGFALTPPAVVLATRVPNDYTAALPGSNYGNVSLVTDPDTEITFMQTQYVNHDQGSSNFRLAVMYGVAVGDINRGQLLTSA